jgi:hypothetical protein
MCEKFAELPVAVHRRLIKNNGSRRVSEADPCNCYTVAETKRQIFTQKYITSYHAKITGVLLEDSGEFIGEEYRGPYIAKYCKIFLNYF